MPWCAAKAFGEVIHFFCIPLAKYGCFAHPACLAADLTGANQEIGSSMHFVKSAVERIWHIQDSQSRIFAFAFRSKFSKHFNVFPPFSEAEKEWHRKLDGEIKSSMHFDQ